MIIKIIILAFFKNGIINYIDNEYIFEANILGLGNRKLTFRNGFSIVNE